MTLEDKEEWKQINDWAIAAGRELQSPQTGLLHLCYTALPGEPFQTIPIYENLLFSLALMRSRTSDGVMEAKTILERMLAFQNHEGNFPIYLHEFPHCRDKYLGAYLLPPLYWILLQFHTVVGAECKNSLENCAKLLLNYTLKISAEYEMPHHLQSLLGASAIALGRLWNDEQAISAGEGMMAKIPKELTSPSWVSPIHLANLLVALQMVYPSLLQSPWSHLLNDLSTYWHPHLAAAQAPWLKELQMEQQPSPTLFDVWMGYYTKVFPKRIHQKKPLLLQGALIHTTTDRLPLQSYPFSLKNRVGEDLGLTRAFSNFAYSLLQQREPLHPSSDRGRRPFRFIWGNPERLHTFVMEHGNITRLDFNEIGNSLELIATLGEPILEDDREKRREIQFFCDHHPDLKMSISGNQSTIFRLGEPIQLESGSTKLQITFSLFEGEGDFIGHLMRGNRLSQNGDKGLHRFTAFDQQIYLRTLRRSPVCRLKILIMLAQDQGLGLI